MHAPVVYRSDDDIDLSEDYMQFRLFYEGRFLSASGDPRPDQPDRRADHKHAIRREFHRQLKDFWGSNRFLREARTNGGLLGMPTTVDGHLHEVIPAVMPILGGFSFCPLVCERFKLICRLDILLLRRDAPGKPGISSRDIDNRLKVLFDALKMPRDMGELGNATPQEGETPLYVLLQADDLISHVSVETDDLLAPPPSAGKDDSFARVLITVKLQPYEFTMFNSGFA